MRQIFSAWAWTWIGIVAALGLGSGCTAMQTSPGPSSEPWYRSEPSPVAPPDWTMAATGAYMGERGRVFYAIGHAGGMRNQTLLRATADNEAQNEMTRVINKYVRALAEAAGPEGEGAPLHLIIKGALQKARIVDHRQGQTGGLMALCSLELSTFKQLIAAEGELEPALRRRMLAEADRVHDQLAGSSKGF